MAIHDMKTITLVAGADLSAKKGYFVKMDSTAFQVVVSAAVTDDVIGVLANKPTSGQAALVCYSGMCKVCADAAIAVGNPIGSADDGQAQVVTIGTETTVYTAGRALEAATAAGEMFTALINLPGHRAA